MKGTLTIAGISAHMAALSNRIEWLENLDRKNKYQVAEEEALYCAFSCMEREIERIASSRAEFVEKSAR